MTLKLKRKEREDTVKVKSFALKDLEVKEIHFLL